MIISKLKIKFKRLIELHKILSLVLSIFRKALFLEMNFNKIAPFGKEDTAKELQDHAFKTQDTMTNTFSRMLTPLRSQPVEC